MPRNPEVTNAIHPGPPYSVMYSKKKKKLRLEDIRVWNGKFDEKLAWAQERGYKKGDNLYEPDYSLI